MQMFAHVIVDGTIVAQSMPVESEDTKEHADWEVVFDCEVLVSTLNWFVMELITSNSPPHAPTFRIAVLRKTQHGIRLLGSIEVGQCHAVLSGEQRASKSSI
jgi:hypothetical protein